ncbi:ABC transporter substrate-binding protein [Amycolatopsis suaedae]|uniref:Extracellular solute-binding protein n=1 Tax=Amycolatopsis suaedae TaxID=2510978 RepID=A0A4Q7J1J9_9PSEU|nr:extracellular solute-binding protein [Amycolatopsis suaedae]RZQ60618.1 extracellular solute-binding protein [Amycolatopsis suaedae]
MNIRKRIVAAAVAAGLAVTLVACSDGGSGERSADGRIAVSINGQPPQTQAFERMIFDQDVAEFEATHPDIDLVPHEGFMEVEQFSAKLAGGQLEDVFYVYFTDPAQIIARRQAADITEAAAAIPEVAQLQPQLLDVFRNAEGKLFGLPTANYSMGLLYNRTLFTRAGLDPNKPPRTWAEVADAAKKISALGGGTVGYADFSRNNQGGWHLTAWINSLGGQVARKDGDAWKADFNNEITRTALNHLKRMRWTDDSMGTKQLLEAADAQRMMGAGQLGMYLAAPDNVPTVVKQFNGKYEDYGLAPIPEAKGTLIGGEGYMVNPKASPEKVKAGLEWIRWRYLNPARFDSFTKRYADAKQPVGLPAVPNQDIWQGEARAQQEAAKTKYANIPAQHYKPYLDAASTIKGSLEPPNAQQVYAALDTVMQAVLTKADANVDELLSAAETRVNGILAQVK